MSSSAALQFPPIIDTLAEHGYIVVRDFLPAEKITALAAEAKNLLAVGNMRRARAGSDINAQPDNSVRGDYIHWLEETDSSAAASDIQQEYFGLMKTLREQINRELFLGLAEIESHFTIYPPGAIYRKHIDQFRGREERQLSSILYLNQNWIPEHGGELRLYLDGSNDTPYLDIAPQGGTLVLFLSGRFWHEVLPATRERISLTGWFRTRA